MRRSVILMVLVLVTVGCETEYDGAARQEPAVEPMPRVEMAPVERGMVAAESRARAAEEQREDRMLQRQARIVVEVEDVDSAAARVRQVAQDLGGRVDQFEQYAGQRETRHISMMVRVPEQRLEDALGRIRELGEVEQLGMSALDVTEEAQDLEVRLRNLRQLENRLLRLLEQRTGDLEEVLAVERELARVRSEIETREMHLEDLERRVRLSTLHVELHEPFPLRERPSLGIPARLARAFVQAGENLVVFVAAFIAALGYLVPIALIVVLIWWLMRWRRGRWMRMDESP